MPVFKGESATHSLVVEDNGWAQPPTKSGSVYTSAKFFQSNDGTFELERGALESEARTPNAELAGQRLGNSNVTGSFPVEIDPENYKLPLESVFYGQFGVLGAVVTLTTAAVTGTFYKITVPMLEVSEGILVPKVGDAYILAGFTDTTLDGVAFCSAFDDAGDTMTFIVPEQTSNTFSATETITITPVDTLRPGKQRQSFNVEEILHAEDGVSEARFMTVGAIASGAEFDLPADGTLKTTLSFVGSGKFAGGEYSTYDAALTDSVTAHDVPADHVKYEPMVLQDGAIISDANDIRCQWLSGTVSIENGTETFFTGCSYDAAGANSGKFRVNVSYEALFESEAAYIAFKAENTSQIVIKLQVRNSEKCLALFLPAFKATSYKPNVGTGLVTASISGSAEIDTDAVNSATLASYIL